MGYGRSFDIGVFGSNFGHAVTQNLPVLVNQDVLAQNNGNPNVAKNDYFPAFTLSQGPPVFTFPPNPSNGVLPLGGPQGNVQPRMRPTFQRLPTLDAWNVTLQRQVTNNTSVEVAYVANKGTHGFAGNGPAYDLNPVAFGPGKEIVTTAGVAPSFSPNTPSDQRRPFFNKFTYPGFTDSTGKTLTCCGAGIMGNFFGNDASSNYKSLQARLDHRFSRGLQFQADYTFSHANNFSNDFSGVYAVAPRLSYGPDDFNRNHVFIFNVVYDLPVGKGKMFAGSAGRALDLIIGGWQVSNTSNWASGLPFTPSAGECGLIHDTGPCNPDYKGGFSTGAGSFDPVKHIVPFFTPVAGLAYPASSLTVGTDACTLARPSSGPFSLPACGTDGNVGRNSFHGPRHFSSDMAVAKNFKFTERFNGQFRVQAYNVFNHPIYAFSSTQGNTCIDCGGNAGQITGLESNFNGSGMRQLEFGLKLSF